MFLLLFNIEPHVFYVLPTVFKMVDEVFVIDFLSF